MSIASKRYALSLFDVALEEDKLEEIYEGFTAFMEVYREDADLKKLLTLKTTPQRAKTALLSKVFSGNVLLKNFFSILLEKDRLSELPLVYMIFKEAYLNHKGILEVTVKSAVPLPEDKLKRVKESLKKKYNKTIHMTAEVDMSLMGGLMIYVGDDVLDLSAKRKLVSLQQQLRQVKVL